MYSKNRIALEKKKKKKKTFKGKSKEWLNLNDGPFIPGTTHAIINNNWQKNCSQSTAECLETRGDQRRPCAAVALGPIRDRLTSHAELVISFTPLIIFFPLKTLIQPSNDFPSHPRSAAQASSQPPPCPTNHNNHHHHHTHTQSHQSLHVIIY